MKAKTLSISAAALITSFIALAAMPHAQAHVTLEVPQATAGGPYKAVLRVGHACRAGGVTTALSVQIPDGVLHAKPMPKAGWAITLTHAALPKPVDPHGSSAAKAVTQITWTATSPQAALPDDYYDEFVLRAQLPKRSGAVWWKVVQTCDQEKVEWTQIPPASAHGTSAQESTHPAARLELISPAAAMPPSAPAPASHHHH